MNPRRWRKMSWLIIIFTVVMAVWAVVAAAAAPDPECGQHAAASPERDLCEAREVVDAGFRVAALFCVWFPGFVILAMIWFVTRPRRRICPVCGTDTKKRQRPCRTCGFDSGATAMPPRGQYPLT